MTLPTATHARSARPATVTLSRTATLASPHPPFPGRPAPANRLGNGRTQGIHAQLSPKRQAGTTPSPPLVRGPSAVATPSVAVRAKPTVPHTAPRPRFPSAMRP